MSAIIKKINLDPLNVISNLTIDEIEQAITFSADKYYNTDKPVISDDVYDLLIDYLKLKNPKSKVLMNIGAISKHKVELDYV